MGQALAVLTEGLSHGLDGAMNTSDTAGDEGELFALLLANGGVISERQRLALLADRDEGLLFNGRILAVEQAAGLISTPVARSTPGRTNQETRNSFAFAALKRDGSVVTWGGRPPGVTARQWQARCPLACARSFPQPQRLRN